MGRIGGCLRPGAKKEMQQMLLRLKMDKLTNHHAHRSSKTRPAAESLIDEKLNT
jgi:hypothetical protein